MAPPRNCKARRAWAERADTIANGLTMDSEIGQYDVVVVGAGNAALTAALSAKEAGARVLVLEKAPHSERGGNSRFSGGLFRFAYNSVDEVKALLPAEERAARVEVGEYSADRFYADLMKVTRDKANPDLSRRLVDESLDTMRWMMRHGMVWDWTHLWSVEASGVGRKYNPGSVLEAKGRGVGLVARLFKAVERQEIEVRYESVVTDMSVKHPEGLVTLSIEDRKGQREISCKAVILGSGGFEANAVMRAQYLGSKWENVKVRGTRHNTGEVLTAALRAGAQRAGQWDGCHATPIDAFAPDVGDLKLTDSTNRLSYPYGIMVNRRGRRFMDEGEDLGAYTYAKAGGLILEQPSGVAFQIFDRKTMHLLEARYETAEPIKGHSTDELADELGIAPHGLLNTVRDFNMSVFRAPFDPSIRDGNGTSGLVPPKSNWALPIDSPPFAAYPVTGGITFTFGGLKIDTEARVLDMSNNPLPGLFATGEITGEFFYHNYPGGSGLMRGAVFGRIAGRNAAEYART